MNKEFKMKNNRFRGPQNPKSAQKALCLFVCAQFEFIDGKLIRHVAKKDSIGFDQMV